MNSTIAGYRLASLVVATTLLGACASTQAPDTDARIVASARQTYVFRTYLKDDDIRIKAVDGIVTLTGTVAEESHGTLAHDTLESLPGVERVDNRLDVTGENPAMSSDKRIATNVKISLRFQRSVSSATSVNVTEGIVTLRGTADSQAERELTAAYAADVEGVKSVKNEITVGAGPSKGDDPFEEQIDDASITAQTRLALASHRSTSALRTKVATQNGVVTLTGEAGNQAEKDLVGRLTRDIDGVKSVTNEMTVKV